MNCNCITEIKKNISDLPFGKTGKKVLTARLLSGALMRVGNRLDLVTTSEFELEVEGQKKKPVQNIIHSFCPFCGTKINESS